MNSAERYMQLRVTLDALARSLTSGPTHESLDLLVQLAASLPGMHSACVQELYERESGNLTPAQFRELQYRRLEGGGYSENS